MTDTTRKHRAPWDVAVHAARPGARFVTPQEFLDGLPTTVRSDMVKRFVTAALADAADTEGILLDFNYLKFFTNHVAMVLTGGDDEQSQPLVYDSFTAIALMQCIASLARDDGLLAHRGNGDSVDYRLTLP